MKSRVSETIIRSGGKLIRTTTTTTVESAEIDFADILEAVRIEPDCMSGTPWDNCDGFDHEARPIGYDSQRIHSRGSCWDAGNRCRVVITVPWDDGLEGWYRERGATRQVAREMVAQCLRSAIDQLTKWYEQGWDWYVCEGEFKGCSDSIGGIDDYDYANGECRTEVAFGIACQLGKRGYVITGKPEVSRPKRDGTGKYNLELFSWKD